MKSIFASYMIAEFCFRIFMGQASWIFKVYICSLHCVQGLGKAYDWLRFQLSIFWQLSAFLAFRATLMISAGSGHAFNTTKKQKLSRSNLPKAEKTRYCENIVLLSPISIFGRVLPYNFLCFVQNLNCPSIQRVNVHFPRVNYHFTPISCNLHLLSVCWTPRNFKCSTLFLTLFWYDVLWSTGS